LLIYILEIEQLTDARAYNIGEVQCSFRDTGVNGQTNSSVHSCLFVSQIFWMGFYGSLSCHSNNSAKTQLDNNNHRWPAIILLPHSLKGKRLKLSTPSLAWQALGTLWSNSQIKVTKLYNAVQA